MRKKNYYIKIDRNAKSTRRKRLAVAAGALLSVYLLASSVLGEMGLVKYYRMKSQYSSLSDEIAKLKIDNARLSGEVYSLRNDAAYLERIARDKLGLARPGEIVYYYGKP